MKSFTVTLSDAIVRDAHTLAAANNRTFDETLSEMTERGIKDAMYRRDRNKKQWAQTKAMKERLAELEDILKMKDE